MEVDITEFERFPVLLGEDSAVFRLNDDVVGHVVDSEGVELQLLLRLDGCDVDELRVDKVLGPLVFELLKSLVSDDNWVSSDDVQWETIVLGDGGDQVDHIDIRVTEEADWVMPVGQLDKLLELQGILSEGEDLVDVCIHELSHLSLELMIRAKEAINDHLDWCE